MANTAFDHNASITVPSSTVNNAVITWNGTTGKSFNNTSLVIIDAGAVTGVTALTASGAVTGGTLAGTVSTATQNSITTMTGLTTVGTVGTGVWNGTAIVQAYIGAEAINESKMQVSNAPTNGYVLTARSGVTGGFTWEAAASGGVDTTGTPANNQVAVFTDADTVEGTAGLTYPYAGQLKVINAGGAVISWLDGSTGQSEIRYNNAGTTKWTLGIDGDGSSNQKSHVDDFGFYSSGGYGVVISGEGTNKFGIGTQAGIALSSAEIPDDGIQFPATQVANASANNLDDYEEGTWTPSVTFGGASSGITYAATRYGHYTKIGDLVTVWGRIELTSNGSSGGHFMITGLPFDPVKSAPISAGGYLSQLTFTGPICMIVDQGTTIMDFYETVSGSGATTMTHADVADSAVIGWTGSYSI